MSDSGLNFLTPGSVHYNFANDVIKKREQVVGKAYSDNPQRFVRGVPTIQQVPDAVWINPPTS